MTPSRVFEERFSAPLNFGKLLGTGLMLGAIAFLLRNHPTEMTTLRQAPPHIAIIDAIAPPAFNPEDAMSPAELMQRWDPTINAAAKRFNVPAAWIRNVMRSESGGRTTLNGQPITSDRGALGLMQVEPGTYTEMAAQYRLGADPFEPRDNIYAGAAYLRWLHGKYGFPAMFAAYNAGPGSLEGHLYHGQPLPQETKLYVAGITKALGQGTDWLVGHDKLTVTAPNGDKIALDRSQIRSVRAALPGEYAPGVAAVIEMGKKRQGVRESPETILAAIGPQPVTTASTSHHHNA
jgi:soluble lytic murein transglycosylase-like protein